MNLLAKVHPGWIDFFEENKDELKEILSKIDFKNETIFPFKKDIFRSLFYFGPSDVKLILIAQDPYVSSETIDGKKIPQAMGLSFSIPKSHSKIPPSLKNIFKEIKSCYPEYKMQNHGSLVRWVKKEKILLLNAALTVIEGKSNSHAKLWANFTDKLIKYISDKNDGCVFLLMGNFAQGKSKLVNKKKHKVFETVHPSPLSAHNGFIGCKVFKEIDDYLISKGKDSIKW